MTRVARLCVVGMLAWSGGGCSAEADTLPPHDVRSAARPAHAEWEREIGHWIGAPARPRAFRAGTGLVALLDEGPPLTPWLFELADSARMPAGGDIRPDEGGSRPPIRDATDVVAVSTDARAWLLDPSTGRVTSEDVGGRRQVVTSIGVRGSVRTACALDERAIAWLDEAHPGRIFVRDLDPASVTRTLPVPPGLAGDEVVPWTSLRFGGSPDGPCVLWAPRMKGVLLVADSAVRALAPFVEPLPERTRRSPLAWLLRKPAPPAPVGALDATSFPGGVAVLFVGRSAEAGRIVDLYAESGDYLETILLPRPALRIAGTRHRLVVLSRRRGRDILASYPLPPRARAHATSREPEVAAPPPPTGTRDVSPDTTTR